jgi:hypothetical protein
MRPQVAVSGSESSKTGRQIPPAAVLLREFASIGAPVRLRPTQAFGQGSSARPKGPWTKQCRQVHRENAGCRRQGAASDGREEGDL